MWTTVVSGLWVGCGSWVWVRVLGGSFGFVGLEVGSWDDERKGVDGDDGMDWIISGDRSNAIFALLPIDVGPRVRACEGSARSIISAEVLIRRHNKSPQRL